MRVAQVIADDPVPPRQLNRGTPRDLETICLECWQATLERYQKRYQGAGKEMGQLAFEDLQIDLLAADSAWVRGRYQLVTGKATFTGLFTLIVKKFPEGWRIVHDHTSS